MANANRKCKSCGEYEPAEDGFRTPAGWFCCLDHAIDFANKKSNERFKKRQDKARKVIEKERRKIDKGRKENARPKSWYTKEAQKWFNKFTRLRDRDLPCICCDTPADANIQWHAGHFLTTGARPEHRFNEDNCHKQTSRCNNYLSGNVAEYRKRLIDKIGIERVEALEQDHQPKHYTVDDLKDIIAKYKLKCKEME